MVAAYRKIHLFDVNIPDGARYAESEVVVPGDKVVVAPTPLGRIGPHRLLRPALPGAVPEAREPRRGGDHHPGRVHALHRQGPLGGARPRPRDREPRLRGRAGAGGPPLREARQTFGNAMIVDPWGVVLARCPDGEGVCVAPFSRAAARALRAGAPGAEAPEALALSSRRQNTNRRPAVR